MGRIANPKNDALWEGQGRKLLYNYWVILLCSYSGKQIFYKKYPEERLSCFICIISIIWLSRLHTETIWLNYTFFLLANYNWTILEA